MQTMEVHNIGDDLEFFIYMLGQHIVKQLKV